VAEIIIESNAKDVAKQLVLYGTKAEDAARRIVEKSAVVIASNARKQFLGSPGPTRKNTKSLGKRGLPYLDGRSQSWPRPTARKTSGESIRDSIMMRNLSPAGGGWTATVGPNLETHKYGRRLEYGGSSTSSMAWGRPTAFSWTINTRPFPYMRPGLAMSEPQLRAIQRDEWNRAFR
jgi:Bacteriophage HK97-gp10, putative tail-component